MEVWIPIVGKVDLPFKLLLTFGKLKITVVRIILFSLPLTRLDTITETAQIIKKYGIKEYLDKDTNFLAIQTLKLEVKYQGLMLLLKYGNFSEKGK